MKLRPILIIFLWIMLLPACDKVKEATEGKVDLEKIKNSFPTDLSVASPTDYIDVSQLTLKGIDTSPSPISAIPLSGPVSQFAVNGAIINKLLGASEIADCKLEPSAFFGSAVNAQCYGPSIDYAGHPDGTPPDGTLPSGDLGMWTEFDAPTGHACAAAQLNIRMRAIGTRVLASLTTLANMICVANSNEIPLPESGDLSLTAEMNALGLVNTTFNSAVLSKNTDGGGNSVFSYSVDLTHNSRNVVVEMSHTPGAAPTEYAGRLSYRIDTTPTGGNCQSIPDATNNASLVYRRSSETSVDVEARFGQFCGAGVDGRDANGDVDPTDKFVSVSNEDGWANNFNIFTANFDPMSLQGNYAFSWQAGMMDGWTRVFNANVTNDVSVDPAVPTVKAFFGFGEDIANKNAAIQGMICNWAGPGNTKSTPLPALVQYQTAQMNMTSGIFSDAVTSNLTYAPSNSCDGATGFTYDVDANGMIDSGEGASTTHALMPVTDTTGTIGQFDEIEAVVTLPAAPTYP